MEQPSRNERSSSKALAFLKRNMVIVGMLIFVCLVAYGVFNSVHQIGAKKHLEDSPPQAISQTETSSEARTTESTTVVSSDGWWAEIIPDHPVAQFFGIVVCGAILAGMWKKYRHEKGGAATVVDTFVIYGTVLLLCIFTGKLLLGKQAPEILEDIQKDMVANIRDELNENRAEREWKLDTGNAVAGMTRQPRTILVALSDVPSDAVQVVQGKCIFFWQYGSSVLSHQTEVQVLGSNDWIPLSEFFSKRSADGPSRITMIRWTGSGTLAYEIRPDGQC